jgi:hypothetical protein
MLVDKTCPDVARPPQLILWLESPRAERFYPVRCDHRYSGRYGLTGECVAWSRKSHQACNANENTLRAGSCPRGPHRQRFQTINPEEQPLTFQNGFFLRVRRNTAGFARLVVVAPIEYRCRTVQLVLGRWPFWRALYVLVPIPDSCTAAKACYSISRTVAAITHNTNTAPEPKIVAKGVLRSIEGPYRMRRPIGQAALLS